MADIEKNMKDMPEKIAAYKVCTFACLPLCLALKNSGLLLPLSAVQPTPVLAANCLDRWQESRKLKEVSLLELLTTTPKERRMKQYRLPR